MPFPELVDHRTWFALIVLLLWGYLAVSHYRLRGELGRNIRYLRAALDQVASRIDEDWESIEFCHQSLSHEIASAASLGRAEADGLRQEIEAQSEAMKADIEQLADAVVNLDARALQGAAVEQPAVSPGKTALFTLRADLDKLRAEVSALQALRRIRPPHQPPAADRRPKLPRTEEVIAALTEKRGDGSALVAEDQKAVN